MFIVHCTKKYTLSQWCFQAMTKLFRNAKMHIVTQFSVTKYNCILHMFVAECCHIMIENLQDLNG